MHLITIGKNGTGQSSSETQGILAALSNTKNGMLLTYDIIVYIR